MMPNLWKPMYLYSTWNTYSLKDILDRVILSSRVSASRTWKFEERRDKISPYQKAHNYGIILAEKEKEGLASDTYFFFSSSTPHHLLFWHSLLHSHMVDQTGILINLFLKRKKKQTEERKEKKKLASQKNHICFLKEARSVLQFILTVQLSGADKSNRATSHGARGWRQKSAR